jgi:hypothetical protein
MYMEGGGGQGRVLYTKERVARDCRMHTYMRKGVEVGQSLVYTVKVRFQESILTRYMALFKLHWCFSLET